MRNDRLYAAASRPDRHDLIVFAVNDEQGHIALGDIFGVIEFPAVSRFILSLGAAQQTLEPEQVAHALRCGRTWAIGAEERRRQLFVER